MKRFLDTVVEEFGKDEAREVFIDDIMERLDSLAKKFGRDEVFHLTANEVGCEDENVLDFLKELDINAVEDKALQEVLRYLDLKMEFERDMLPAEVIGELYDEMTVNPWEAKISKDKSNEWER